MDPALVTGHAFWDDPAPFAAGPIAGGLPDFPQLAGHALFQTSGSTGAPRWIALAKSALLTSARAVNEHLGVTRESIWGLALPLHHVGGFGIATRAHAAACACHAFPGKWEAAVFTNWLAAYDITHTSLVPTQVHDLVKAGLAAPTKLRTVVVGGGSLADHLGVAARQLGWPVLASFGMTESASQIATARLDSLDAPFAHAPLPVLPIWHTRLSPEGCLEISGPALFSGSLERLPSGSWEWLPRDGNWHATRDLVSLTADGLTPLGRADLMVKCLGELVDIEQVEREIIAASHGRIMPGALVVVALADARAGHLLAAVTSAEIPSDVARSALAAYSHAAPGFRRVSLLGVVCEIPCSPLGKPKRREIAEIAKILNFS